MQTAPVKPNNGKMNLAQRQVIEEPSSPSKFRVAPDAPKKEFATKRARDETGPEPVSPFKRQRNCPDAPKKDVPTKSFVSSYVEDPDEWLMDSYIEQNPEPRPITWAPHKKDRREVLSYAD